jgi:hypothetical protein
MTPDNLQDRETSRRKALWTLAHLQPGDPKAVAVIQVLDDIAVQDEESANDTVRINALRNVIETEARSNGLQIIREASIPQRWRERFLQASRGSTRHIEGPYLHDFQKFITLWKRENDHLDAHRIAWKRHIEEDNPQNE